MKSDELFSFLQPIAASEVVVDTNLTDNESRNELKRRAGSPPPFSASANDADIPSKVDGSASGPSYKRRRQSSTNLFVLDEVEIDSMREVTSDRGLQGPVEDGTRIELRHQVRHQVAVPSTYPYVPISQHVPPTKPARNFKFNLGPFQQVSVHAIQRNESVLVSAHMSAGKTVVAEYVIAQFLLNRQRVIYTSPIKALSNQKYRDSQVEFEDVGLMTGDITINPSASCLVVTTEILRSMLYRGSEIMREVAWVVFDEIHYMRDKERGVIWEETIILLPHTVRYAFLSATIPNAMQFAEWVCKLHDQPCHVVYTDFRPTPLQHYLFPSGGDEIHLVVNEKGEFREDNFNTAMGMIQQERGDDPANYESGTSRKANSRKGTEKKEPADIQKFLRTIMARHHDPVIVFAFSKRECEDLALTMSNVDFNDAGELESVAVVFANAIDVLSPDDRVLPQITNVLPLLRRGIGIHRGGLLPILKEVVELLFQDGLIKVLFATETFSIGLNMPAKTVIFTTGLDDRGVVVLMCDKKLEPPAAKEMIKGQADCLNSAFRLGYNMILNLMKMEGITMEYMLERSFYQFQNCARIPILERELWQEEDRKRMITIPDESLVAEYSEYRQQLDQLAADFKTVITDPAYSLPFLQPGRLVKVKQQEDDFGWGVIISCQKRRNRPAFNPDKLPANKQYIVDVLLACDDKLEVSKDRSALSAPNHVRPPPPGHCGVPLVVPVLLSTLYSISRLRVYLPKDPKSLQARESLYKSVQEIHRRFQDGIPLLDPVSDMGITNEKFKVLVKKIHVLENKLSDSKLHGDSRLPGLYALYTNKMSARSASANSERTYKPQETSCRWSRRMAPLQWRLHYVSPEQCAALLSCFVFAEKSSQVTKLRGDLARPLRAMQEIARRIARVSIESKLAIVEDEYVQSFKVELMDPVMQWCRGASFAHICKLTDQFEGNIIRVFRRLQELTRQMRQAARVIGNVELEEKFEEALEMLERPNSVIFCSSLYL
ncbi:antiviral helicase [Laetiporus sulphureus 93-53]|uniref:Antiviral helicase n=1 Tax=Laetiporus sulphureus 93-53 TaxID=1314785 RepID=A0A165BQ75_9APHY|nr:antiviral helicase [Laetiporus sulphureus 93-53]KZT01456.1 antiviral helicase [Laetiporus sulphureus 93-53]